MTTHDDLIHEVLDHPDEDGPRLVVADWLEEHGDPRGEFIRIQCELAAMDGWSARRLELLRSEREFLARHKQSWLKPLGAVRDALFRRGFLHAVTLDTATFLSRGEQLFRAAPLLRGVRLTRIGERFRELAESPWLASVSELSLRAANPSYHELVAVLTSRHLDNLTALDLAQNQFGTSVVPALRTTEHLQRLESLDLSMSRISASDLRGLCGVRSLPRLQTLFLGGNSCKGRSVAEALAESTLPLKRLGMTRLHIENSGAAILAGSARLADASHLGLAKNGLDAAAARTIAHGAGFARLAYFDLGCNRLGDQGAEALAESPLRELRFLDLRTNGIGNRGGEALCQSPVLEKIKELDVRYNRFDDTMREKLIARFGERVRVT